MLTYSLRFRLGQILMASYSYFGLTVFLFPFSVLYKDLLDTLCGVFNERGNNASDCHCAL